MVNNDCRMSKRQKSLFAADFSAASKSKKLLFASISFGQKSTNFLSKFVSKSKICCRNSRISTFDCRYNTYIIQHYSKFFKCFQKFFQFLLSSVIFSLFLKIFPKKSFQSSLSRRMIPTIMNIRMTVWVKIAEGAQRIS